MKIDTNIEANDHNAQQVVILITTPKVIRPNVRLGSKPKSGVTSASLFGLKGNISFYEDVSEFERTPSISRLRTCRADRRKPPVSMLGTLVTVELLTVS